MECTEIHGKGISGILGPDYRGIAESHMGAPGMQPFAKVQTLYIRPF